jgi:hypothetical protein
MEVIAADRLLRLPVRLHGIQLGRPVDLLLDADARRVIGIDLLCADEAHRFLPLAAAEVEEEHIVVRSAFTLLDDAELAFYRTKGLTLRALRGTAVRSRAETVGVLRDLELGADGAVARLLLADGDGERWVDVDGLRLGSARAA